MSPGSAPDAGPRSAPIWMVRSTTSWARPLASYATICTTSRPRGTWIGEGQRDDEGPARAPVAIPGSGHGPAGAHHDGLCALGLQHHLHAPRRFAHVTADHEVARGDDLVGACRRGHGQICKRRIERRSRGRRPGIRGRGRAHRRDRADRRRRLARRFADAATGEGNANDRDETKTPRSDGEPPRPASAGPAPPADRALEPRLS